MYAILEQIAVMEKIISIWQPNKAGVYIMPYGREEEDKKKKVDRTPQRKPILVLLTTVLKNEKSAPISNCLAMCMHNQSCSWYAGEDRRGVEPVSMKLIDVGTYAFVPCTMRIR